MPCPATRRWVSNQHCTVVTGRPLRRTPTPLAAGGCQAPLAISSHVIASRAPSINATDTCAAHLARAAKRVVGRRRGEQDHVNVRGGHTGHIQGLLACLSPVLGQALALPNDVPAPDARARGDPLVVRVDPALQVRIGEDSVRGTAAHAHQPAAGQAIAANPLLGTALHTWTPAARPAARWAGGRRAPEAASVLQGPSATVQGSHWAAGRDRAFFCGDLPSGRLNALQIGCINR